MNTELLVPCPYPGRLNPCGPLAAEQARRMAAEAGLTGGPAERVLGGIALADAAALTYPDADPDRLGVATSWIAFLVLFDDAWSDLLSFEDGWLTGVLAQHRAVTDVLDGGPPRGDPLVRLLARILDRIAELDPGFDSRRLRQEIRRYLAGTLWELDLRRRAEVPDLGSYLVMRRVFSTMTVQRELDCFVWDLRLPAAVREHPCLQLVDIAIADYGCVANDLYSLDAERSAGITSNVVVVLQHEYGWDLNRAVGHARRLCEQALVTYERVRADPARFGLPVSGDLTGYLDHYESFVSAAARWPARSARYRADAAGPVPPYAPERQAP